VKSNINPNHYELHQIAQEIGEPLRNKYRISVVDCKEKLGTVRVYCTFGWYNLHDVVHPGYVFNRFPPWLQTLDYYLLGPIVHQLSRLIVPLQIRAYRRAYQVALVKYPQHRTAILSCTDWPEYLKGL
jgi:hypothetical protein